MAQPRTRATRRTRKRRARRPSSGWGGGPLARAQDEVGHAARRDVLAGRVVYLDLDEGDGAAAAEQPELVSRYLFGPGIDQVLAQDDLPGGQTRWLLTDHLRTVRDIIDDAGDVLNHIVYDSFGNVLGQTDPTVASRYLFTGRELDGRFGRGITVQLDASMTVERARIERVIDFGIAGIGEGARLTATDVTVSGITPQECSGGVCAGEPGGHGIGSYFSANVSVRRFGVDAASLCGVQVAEDATLSLGDGTVQGALIGACLQSDAQDIADLQNDVHYFDNGSNFEATMLPVPAPIGSTE